MGFVILRGNRGVSGGVFFAADTMMPYLLACVLVCLDERKRSDECDRRMGMFGAGYRL